MSNYTKGYEDGVRATKAEYLKLLKEENLHPVKELTDDEVIKLWDSIDIVPYQGITGRLKVFARAILKKAQEK